MVCFNHDNSSLRSQSGDGIIDTLLKPFTATPRFAGEHHAISLANDTFGTPMNFMGQY